ncbi:MAG: class I SAM-dependent methyltransferase [Anaerolineae bacterium]|nr:class I SAM-dependent methyltransferase [Anaerolineae bacterium]
MRSEPMRRSHQYAVTAMAFGEIAPDYDAAYGTEGNAMMTWMRGESLAILQAEFAPGSRLLELGCGTGEEAVALAQASREVLATDIAPRMAAIARAKAIRSGVGGHVQVVALPAGYIDALRPLRPFDGGYASFGALNCEPDLLAVGTALGRLIRPGGAFVTSIMGRTCLFEVLWYTAHLRPRRALRRLGGGWHIAPVAGEGSREVSVPTRYLTIRQVAAAFPVFVVERALALPLLLPPPYADSLYRRHVNLFRRLAPCDRRLRGRWPWRQLGDHTVLVLRRL